MFKRGGSFLIIGLVLAILTVSQVSAEENPPNVAINLIDSLSGESIGDVFITLILDQDIRNYYLESEENLRLNLQQGNYEVIILVDDPKTEGFDYYTENYLEVRENLAKQIFLYPVGSLSGFVKDNLDNVVSGADLKFECNEVFNIDYPEITDKFGSFSLRFVPIGNCKIYGSFEGETGITEVEVEKGSLATVNINLNTGLVREKPTGGFYLIPLVLIIMILIGIIGLFLMKNNRKAVQHKSKKEETERSNGKSEQKIGQRGEDILKTLRKNEKIIIEYLLETNDSSHLSKIHYKTGISKGALFRNIKSLEQKNLIETYSEGRVKKIKLSEWFLE